MHLTTVPELLSDAGWQKMVWSFAAAGKIQPRREDTYLKFKRI